MKEVIDRSLKKVEVPVKTLATQLFLILFSLPTLVLAHGEDKAGPHGGYIRMPGSFHTEVVAEKNGYRVYLLDINWKNPSVLDSSVTANIQVNQKKIVLSCTRESDSYLCQSSLPQNGELHVIAKREGQSGGISSYKLPLKFEIPKNEMPEHKGH